LSLNHLKKLDKCRSKEEEAGLQNNLQEVEKYLRRLSSRNRRKSNRKPATGA